MSINSSTPHRQTSCFNTPAGELYVVWRAENQKPVVSQLGITALSPKLAASNGKLSPLHKQIESAFDRYFDGDIEALKHIRVDLCGLTEFQANVLNWIHTQVMRPVSYGGVAKAVGSPRAARAVGSALRINPVPIIIPCHRVIPKRGGLGGYMGQSEYGSHLKSYLLWHESAGLTCSTTVHTRRSDFKPCL